MWFLIVRGTVRLPGTGLKAEKPCQALVRGGKMHLPNSRAHGGRAERRVQMKRGPPTEAAFTSMLRSANDTRQAVDEILDPTIFVRNCL